MQVQKGSIEITVCDMCGDTLKFVRVSGHENYEDAECSVCSNCCATPEINNGETKKIEFLIEFHKKSQGLCSGVPPFWPKNPTGIIMDIDSIVAMAT